MITEADIVLRIQQSLSSPFGRVLVALVARWLIFLYVPFALLIKRSKLYVDAVYAAGWTALLALTMSTVLAQLIGRVRPYLAVPGVEAIVPPNIQSGSFPSSHTAVAVGIAVALSSTNVPVGVAAFLVAGLVAFGRVASGMHFPTDLVGGAAVGVLAFLIVRFVQQSLSQI
ncbi:phosphatase PAP2 family protein [Candidatus Uhrbacteria bacterium]|nr:phosphatase PAP2 family protein [Candidatus Uhrbacteria bacterium]MBD3284077.1 phosphatase PAP2 family protein [Candidatus Uhrbacteria bacterium]